MNSDILALQYKKAQVYMQNRPRRVTFALHHRLYRSVKLSEDLQILERERFNPAGPLESRVWGEKLDQTQLESYMTLVEGTLFSFYLFYRNKGYPRIDVNEAVYKFSTFCILSSLKKTMMVFLKDISKSKEYMVLFH